MNKDVGRWASTCLGCQKTKVTRHVRPPVRRIDMLSCHFSHIHVDLSAVCGFTNVFTVFDRSIQWPAAYPVQDTSTDTSIATLAEWISGFYVPAKLTSDCGSQFTSSAWSAFCRFLDIEHITTTA